MSDDGREGGAMVVRIRQNRSRVGGPAARERPRVASRHALALADGRTLHVQEWPGHGRPLVLLHGLMASAENWTELARASRRHCVALDLPGFGLSDPPTRSRIEAYAEAVTDCLRALDVRQCTLVGHSLGGAIATAAAERLPRQVAALVLCAPAGFGRLAIAELAALPVVREVAVAALLHVAAHPHLLAPVYASVVTNGVDPTPELSSALQREAARIGPGVRAGIEAVAAAGASRRAFHRRTVAYRGPVSLVWGARDTVVPPSHIRGVLRALPQTRVHLWPGMGHHPQVEQPARLAALVEATARGPHDARVTPLATGRLHAAGVTRAA